MFATWLLGVFAAGLAFGQDIEILAFEPPPQSEASRTSQMLDRLTQLSLGQLNDPAAQAMLRACVVGSETFLRWKLAPSTEAIALVDRDLDILVAHWGTNGRSDLPQSVWLWDDPVTCRFLLPMSDTGELDRGQLEKILRSLWVWWQPAPPPAPVAEEPAPVTAACSGAGAICIWR